MITDLRCIVGRHAYPTPGKNHPVSASQVSSGRVTLVCPRCQKAKTIAWKPGPPRPDVNPPMGFP